MSLPTHAQIDEFEVPLRDVKAFAHDNNFNSGVFKTKGELYKYRIYQGDVEYAAARGTKAEAAIAAAHLFLEGLGVPGGPGEEKNDAPAPELTVPVVTGVDFSAVRPLTDTGCVIIMQEVDTNGNTVLDGLQAATALDPIVVSGTTYDDYAEAIAIADAARAAGSPMHGLENGIDDQRAEHWVAVRQPLIAALSDPDNWTVNGAAPTAINVVPVGIGDGKTGLGNVDWRWAVYLARDAQHAGTDWAVAYGSNTAAWDQAEVVSWAIQCSQVSYKDQKSAYIGMALWGLDPELVFPATAPDFSVINADTGAVVWSGTAGAVLPDHVDGNDRQMHGVDELRHMDFSAFDYMADGGWYYLQVDGIGRSWPFKMGAQAFGEAFYDAYRGIFHHLRGRRLEKPFTHWERKDIDPFSLIVHETPYVRGPAYGDGPTETPSSWNGLRMQILEATLNAESPRYFLDGGVYDAGDYDAHIWHTVISDNIFEAALRWPTKFADGQLSIPESGDGIPDAINLALWQMRPYLAMQKRYGGGIGGMIESVGHSAFGTDKLWGVAQPDRWSTFSFAATAAKGARWFEAHLPNSPWGATLRQAAIDGYAWAADEGNSIGTVQVTLPNETVAEMTETQGALDPDWFKAQIELYLLTEDTDYLTGIDDRIDRIPKQTAFFWHGVIDFCGVHVATGDVPTARQTYVKETWFEGEANRIVGFLDDNGYRATWKEGAFAMGFGNLNGFNMATFLMLAEEATGNDYSTAIAENITFALGANPMGLSWTTGLGWAYPQTPQHALSHNDDIDEPTPGISLYGPTGTGMYNALKKQTWGEDEDTPFWTPPGSGTIPKMRVWSAHPSLFIPANEYTVHQTMSRILFVLASLIEGTWMPGDHLPRAPKAAADLHGWMYLP